MDDNYNKVPEGPSVQSSGTKIKGIGDFLLILRDRWLILRVFYNVFAHLNYIT